MDERKVLLQCISCKRVGTATVYEDDELPNCISCETDTLREITEL